MSLWSLSSSCVFKPGLISLMYSALSIACCNVIVFHFWSLNGVDGPLDSPPYVRSSVHAHFPENPHIRIFWFFVLKNEKMNKKVTFLLFHQKFENGPFLAKNGPKLAFLAKNAQKWWFLAFFRKLRVGISQFFAGSLASAVQKYYGFRFSGKFENWPFLAKIDPNLAYIWLIWLDAVIAGNRWKTWK